MRVDLGRRRTIALAHTLLLGSGETRSAHAMQCSTRANDGMLSVNVSVTAGRWRATSSQSSGRHLVDLLLALLQVAGVPYGQPPIADCGGGVESARWISLAK